MQPRRIELIHHGTADKRGPGEIHMRLDPWVEYLDNITQMLPRAGELAR